MNNAFAPTSTATAFAKRIATVVVVAAAALALAFAATIAQPAKAYAGGTSPETAKAISLNTTYADSLKFDLGMGHDWFQIEPSKQGKITISFTHTYMSGYGDFRIDLCQKSGEVITSYYIKPNDKAGTHTDITPTVGVAKGTVYKIKVSGGPAAASISYKIKVNFTANSSWECEPWNNDGLGGDTLPMNSVRYANIYDWAKDTDVFAFNAPKSTYYRLAFVHALEKVSDSGYYIALYKAGTRTNPLKEWSIAGDDKTTSHTHVLTTPKLTAGYYEFVIRGDWNNQGSTYNIKLNYNMAKATVTIPKSAYAYTGTAIKPLPTVKMGGTTLTKDSSYTVTWSNNTAVGTAKITIKGKGNYAGTYTKTFAINPKVTAISSLTGAKDKFTVKWAKNSQATGYQICYSTSSSMTSPTYVTIDSASTISKTISYSTSKAKTLYVKMAAFKTVGGKRYFSAWSTVKTVTVQP